MALVMLDTSWCIEILRGRQMPEEWRAHRFCISSVVEMELWAGVFHSDHQSEQKRVEKLLSTVEVLNFDRKAAKESGRVLGSLAKQGISIGDFDSQIAGHTLSANAMLATKNAKHFARIDKIKLL